MHPYPGIGGGLHIRRDSFGRTSVDGPAAGSVRNVIDQRKFRIISGGGGIVGSCKRAVIRHDHNHISMPSAKGGSEGGSVSIHVGYKQTVMATNQIMVGLHSTTTR